jgi:hypothetical protein
LLVVEVIENGDDLEELYNMGLGEYIEEYFNENK